MLPYSGRIKLILYILLYATGLYCSVEQTTSTTSPYMRCSSESAVIETEKNASTDVEREEVMQILSEMQQKLTHKLPVPETKNDEVDPYFENDIMLTPEQAQEVLQQTKSRKKRKLSEATTTRWKLPIRYCYDGSHNELQKKRIADALSYWSELTCISFLEDCKADYKLVFAFRTGCWSYVGFTGQENQTISIGDSCQSNGTIAHELGHAIGFWHEQSRPDRDEHVTIHNSNIAEGKLYNFQKRSWRDINNKDIPYGLESIMHYGRTYYAKDANGSLITIEPRESLKNRVLGQRQELSFFDVKLANIAYCDDICSSYDIKLFQPCQRDGYQDPKNCWRCRCPDGFGGSYCERVAISVNAYCGGVLDARYGGTIYSPGYPSPGYRPDIKCSWLIKAPDKAQIYLEFIDDFGITGHYDVCRDFVEVRYNTSLAVPGARFCCTDPPRFPIRSDINEMLVLFRTFRESQVCDDTKFPWKCQMSNVGFKARFYTKSCGGCMSLFSPQPACLQRIKHACQQTWEEHIQPECPSWWRAEDCGPRTVIKKRNAICYRDQPYCCSNFQLNDNQCITKEKSVILSSIDSSKTVNSAADVVNGKSYPTSSNHIHSISTLSSDWSDWSDWSNCSRVCGGGVSVRTRQCLRSGFCGSNNIQADKRPCGQEACYEKCAVEKKILCDLWTTCTRIVYEPCRPSCFENFTLSDNLCVPKPLI